MADPVPDERGASAPGTGSSEASPGTTPAEHGTGHPRLAVVSTAGAAFALVAGWLTAASLQAAGTDWSQASMTALAARDTPHRWAMTLAFALTGLAHLVGAWALPRLRWPGRGILALGGAATLVLAATPAESAANGSWLHTAVAVLALAAGASWPWWTGRGRIPRAVTASLLALIATLLLTVGSPAAGIHERLVTTVLVLVPFGYAVWQWWVAGHPTAGPRTRALLGVGALTVLCAVGGTAATVLAPAGAQTRHYSATFSLSPDPADLSQVTARTLFGDITVRFSGIAPGIEATPQVKPAIAEILSSPSLSVRELEPDPEELANALRVAALGLAGRYVLGAAVVALLAVGAAGALAAGRTRDGHPPPRGRGRRLLAGGLAATTIASGATAAAVGLTYRPERSQTFTSTGVLGMVERNRQLLADVEARSTQVGPYLRNLIALSSALQDRYAPTSLGAPVALRLLLVSDLHDGNQYDLLRSIIEEEDIDAVVDSGDLLTFGTVDEGEAAGMFAGIASLHVPYLFVRGNHDATSRTDDTLLTRMSQISNVILLQPTSTTYTDVVLNGVRIRGFNDPRWFGDSGTRTAQAQRPAVAAYETAFAGTGAPDILVSHEPAAVIGQAAGVLVNGHMHVADLDGNRIQVGTFTGGGPFAHFVPAEDGAELVGQPSAFDIVTIGDTCRLTSLTRYRFRDVLEGRPAYDSVSLINGSRIDRRPPDPRRTCSRTGTLETSIVVAPSSSPARGTSPGQQIGP